MSNKTDHRTHRGIGARHETFRSRVTKIGHVVLNCQRPRAVDEVLHGNPRLQDFRHLRADMVPGGMVFMRFNADHHGVGLVGAMPGSAENIELHHLAFAVATLDEVLRVREHLEKNNVHHRLFMAGGVPAHRSRSSSPTRMAISSKSSGVSTRSAATTSCGRASEWRPATSLEEAIDNPVSGQDTTARGQEPAAPIAATRQEDDGQP